MTQALVYKRQTRRKIILILPILLSRVPSPIYLPSSMLFLFLAEWTVVQLSRELDTADVVGLTKEHRNGDPTLLVTRLSCGESVER